MRRRLRWILRIFEFHKVLTTKVLHLGVGICASRGGVFSLVVAAAGVDGVVSLLVFIFVR